MPQVIQAGALNTTALIVPDLYVQIQPPAITLNGIPTDIAGVVGAASWGPVNAQAIVGSMADYVKSFGPIMNRLYDAGTLVAQAVLEGASNFRVVRVTDGTDTAATGALGSVSFAAKYTGIVGNSLTVAISAGSAVGTQRVTVAAPGLAAEVFDNIVGNEGDFTAAIVAAITHGSGPLQGPSKLVTASTVGTPSQATGSVTLTGGTDGAAGVTAATLIGSDSATPRTGMYALRKSGASVIALADVTDYSTFNTQVSFGLAEGAYMIAATPASDAILNAVAAKAAAGVDSYAIKIMFGDWIVFADPVNKVTRLVSPQGAMVGLLTSLSPEQSSLNKQARSIAATQSSAANVVYSNADLGVLAQNGFDVFTNPVPGGNYFGARLGLNTSSNPVNHGDNYTRLTNYIAFTIASGAGKYIGKLQSGTVRTDAKGTLSRFLSAMEMQGMIGDVNGGPAFSIQLDAKNNPDNRVSLGYMQSDVQVKYLSVIEKFIVNLDGSQATVVHQTIGQQ